MELATYLDQNGTSLTDFAGKIGTTIEAVRKYKSKERMPKPDIMARITAATDGQVTANDFYQAVSHQPSGRRKKTTSPAASPSRATGAA